MKMFSADRRLRFGPALATLSLLLAAVPLAAPLQAKSSAASSQSLPAGVTLKALTRGKGAKPTAGDTVLVNYQIKQGDQALTSAHWQILPINQAMAGLSAALPMMQKGGRYRVTLTNDQAFGDNSPLATSDQPQLLDIEIELLDFAANHAAPTIGAAQRDDSAATALITADAIKYAATQPGVMTTESGLKYKQLSAGEGERPKAEDTVLVGYEGRLLNGRIFDSNPQASFPVAGVVPGFGEALRLMQKGGTYRVWIPPTLGYGERGAGDAIPPNSWLVFDVQLIDYISAADLQKLRAGAASPPK